jgi:hypothetical protein
MLGRLGTVVLGLVEGALALRERLTSEEAHRLWWEKCRAELAREELELRDAAMLDLRSLVQALAWSPKFATFGDYHACQDCGAEFVTPDAWGGLSLSTILRRHGETVETTALGLDDAAARLAILERCETLHSEDCEALRGLSTNASLRAVRFEATP